MHFPRDVIAPTPNRMLGAPHILRKVTVGELRGFHELLVVIDAPEFAAVAHA